MWIDLKPLKTNRDFRYVYAGQFISFFGTMLTYVAIPFQVYQLTNSTLMVGLLGVVELVPLLLTAFIGGALADVMDKKKLLIYCEIGMAFGCLLLLAISLMPQSSIAFIFVIAAFMSALSGLHRPSLDALIPRLVKHEEIQAASILVSFKSSVGLIGGPAVAGLCISYFGLSLTYTVDCLTFVLSIAALSRIKSYIALGAENREQFSFKTIKEAITYAISRQELLGTYFVDFFAMVFAMPNALFPAMAKIYGGTKILGWFYSAPAVGSLIITLFSGWSYKIKRHGAAVILAATLWGLAMMCVGLSSHLFFILFFLVLAGAADAVSGIYRVTIWNETIPDSIRGRMASLEMISYMSGPLLGNAQAGLMASRFGTQKAITLGAGLCIAGVMLCFILLPQFWRYRRQSHDVRK
ncbi:MAG: MFS transporter [Proteobacteria bacterium]|nr:MFS transporter [Pseudomonadota bacterium]